VYNFGFILIGKGIEYLPYFVYSFNKMGERGLGRGKSAKFIVKEIISENCEQKIIYDEKSKKFYNNPVIIKSKDFIRNEIMNSEKICIRFISPARIKYNSKYINNLEFHVFFRNLIRRISLLLYFHCDKKADIDFKDLIKKAHNIRIINSDLKWYDWIRYSNRQGSFMKMGGLVGSVEYAGDFREFYQWLSLGEYIHIGKGVSFGNGKYIIKI